MKLRELLDLIDVPNKTKCLTLFEDNKGRFEKAPGSLSKHQSWEGGYLDHLEETMNFSADLFNLMNNKRQLDFSLSDVLLVLFLHDLEKPFRYTEPKIELNSDKEKEVFIKKIIDEYGISLKDNHINALKYIHGEGDEYSRTERIQKPLAAFCHICDVASARIWFDYPKK